MLEMCENMSKAVTLGLELWKLRQWNALEDESAAGLSSSSYQNVLLTH